ncbi:MFS transporter [Brachybacterium sp. EF45031]|uniref:MFS transporter n=1 Tax=Brachybacterium sillae TaxID=2810536 RepID=UPI00217D03DD|nr:MFS transporter [Brachybacterium sillae]MCS6711115.1 MFS transporter [Brachybacterium sillae]
MDAYRRVLAVPGALPLLILGFLARIPFSALGLLLTLHVVLTLHLSYLAAGLIVTASTVGSAISSPWRGRIVDRRGLRRAVAPSIVVQTASLIAAAYAPYWGLVLLALLGGIYALPVFAVVRTSLAVLVPATHRRSAFALDSVLTEIVFMIGPAGATVLALQLGTRETMLVVAALVAAAGVGLAVVNPPTRSDQITLPVRMPAALDAAENAVLGASPSMESLRDKRTAEDLSTGAIPVIDPDHEPGRRRDEREGGRGAQAVSARDALLTLGGLAVLVATAVGSLELTATDLAIVAILDGAGRTGLVGVIMVMWCAGSVIGGTVYGAMTRQIPPLWVLLALGALTVPIALAHGPVMLGVTVFVAGVACAPIISATGEAISHLVPEEVRGEAMGWHGTAMTIGAAVGGPVIGLIIDAAGPGVAIASAGLLGVVVAVAGLTAQRMRRTRRRALLRQRFSG